MEDIPGEACRKDFGELEDVDGEAKSGRETLGERQLGLEPEEAEGGTAGSMADLGAWIGMDGTVRQQGVDIQVGVGQTGQDLVAWHGEETLGEVEVDKCGQEVRKTGSTGMRGK